MVAVTLIGKSNGVGLARDLRLLAEALRQCGCEVRVHAANRTDGRKRRSRVVRTVAQARAWLRRRRTDAPAVPKHINVMLEHVWPQFLHTAELNIAVPNPEWFDHRDQRLLGSIDGVWTKTHHAQALFGSLGCHTAFIGFDSEDRLDRAVARECSFFHLAGKSRLKGTERLLRVWLRHPEWPRLVLVCHDEGAEVVPQEALGAGNIDWYREYLPDGQLKQLQNASRFHLCLSEAEGWGHYIVEAMSVGAVTLTLDAPPMNELVQPDRGVLVPAVSRRRQNLSDAYAYQDAALEQAVAHALSLDEAAIVRLGESARRWFEQNRASFTTRVGQALGRLDSFVAR